MPRLNLKDSVLSVDAFEMGCVNEKDNGPTGVNKSKARIIRDGTVVFSGEIMSIFREKNQVKEVGAGLECGISIKDFIDFKENDVIESYQSEEIRRSI